MSRFDIHLRHVLALLAHSAVFCAVVPANAQTRLVMQSSSPAPGLFNMHFYIAEKVGFFKDENITAEIRYATGGPQATQIMASGGADIAMVSEEPLLQAWDKGMRASVFYQLSYSLIYFIAVDAGSPYMSASDLRGKKIGVSNLGSGSIVFARAILKDADAAPGADTFLPVGLGNGALAALKSGRVDALSLWDTAYAAMELQGSEFRYFKHKDEKSMGFGAGYLATAHTIETKRDALIGFSRAIAKATVFAEENPRAALEIYWKANPAGKVGSNEVEIRRNGEISMNSALQTMNINARPGGRYGAIDVRALTMKVALLSQEKFIAIAPPVGDFSTSALIEAANAFDLARIKTMAREWK